MNSFVLCEDKKMSDGLLKTLYDVINLVIVNNVMTLHTINSKWPDVFEIVLLSTKCSRVSLDVRIVAWMTCRRRILCLSERFNFNFNHLYPSETCNLMSAKLSFHLQIVHKNSDKVEERFQNQLKVFTRIVVAHDVESDKINISQCHLIS